VKQASRKNFTVQHQHEHIGCIVEIQRVHLES
jgi:hypothetical protein